MRIRRAVSALAVGVLAAGAVVTTPTTAGAAPTLPTGAIRQVGTLADTQTSSYQNWNWAHPDPVDQFVTPAGYLAVVRHSRTALTIDTLDPSTLETVDTRTVPLDPDFPLWGGFLAGDDGGFWVLSGRSNPTESATRDVVAIQRFSATWEPTGTAYVRGGATQGGVQGIYDPFDATAPDMTLAGGRLVVHMARLINEQDGVHHQVNLTVEVNTSTMVASTFDELGGGAPYSSHSFRQLATSWGDDLVLVDHGDAYPRTIQLGVVPGYPASHDASTYSLFPFNGQVGDNVTGASVTGLASGTDGVLVAGNSIPQPDAPNGALGQAYDNRNAFVISADPATGEHTVHWLSDYSSAGSATALEPRIVPLSADRFVVLFGVKGSGGYRTEYRLLDSAGTVLATKSFPGLFFASLDDPVVVGHSLLWVGPQADPQEAPTPAYLYGLDVIDPTAPTLDSRAARPFDAVGTPMIAGTPRTGRTLTAQPGDWQPAPAFAYRWYADGRAIAGATARTFRLTAAQYGTTVTVRVSGTHAGRLTTARTSAGVTVLAGTLTSSVPTIGGTAKVGATLTARPGTWGPAPVSLRYGWYAGSVKIAGATRSTFRPTSAQRGQRLTVHVAGVKSGYRTVVRASAATAAVTG